MTTPRRRSPRLPAYDYREVGVYFVTVCSHERRCVFGDVDDGETVLNRLGLIARDEWLRTFDLRPYLERDAFVVMPNHVHLLFGLWTHEEGGNRRSDRRSHRNTMHGVATLPHLRRGALEAIDDAGALVAANRFGQHGAMSVSAVVGTYKASVTRRARREGIWDAAPLWQGRYHDRVVRNQAERNAIRDYIATNPLRWQKALGPGPGSIYR